MNRDRSNDTGIAGGSHSYCALINMLGNGVVTVVVARWEREVDRASLAKALG